MTGDSCADPGSDVTRRIRDGCEDDETGDFSVLGRDNTDIGVILS